MTAADPNANRRPDRSPAPFNIDEVTDVEKLAEMAVGLAAMKNAIDEQIKDIGQRIVAQHNGREAYEGKFGIVKVAQRADIPKVADTQALCDWMEEHGFESEIVDAPSERFMKGPFKERFVVDGEDVVDVETGEIMAWATFTPGKQFTTHRVDPDELTKAKALVAERVSVSLAEQLGLTATTEAARDHAVSSPAAEQAGDGETIPRPRRRRRN